MNKPFSKFDPEPQEPQRRHQQRKPAILVKLILKLLLVLLLQPSNLTDRATPKIVTTDATIITAKIVTTDAH